MSERTVLFARSASLVGVVTDADAPASRPAFVFLNAGMIPRVGPNRLHVRLARELARHGFTSLRFDLSGLGDSTARRDGLPFRAAAVADTREALDTLATSGASTFVLAGLCSGADLAFRVALTDPRVVGLVLIDGLPYHTRRARLHFVLNRLLRYGAWRKLFAPRPLWRVLRRGGGCATRPASLRPGGLGKRDVPSHAEAATGLRALTARGVHVLAIFTEGREYTYRGQFRHSFPGVRADRVRVEYLEDADHTFTLRANQDRLERIVIEWSGGFR